MGGEESRNKKVLRDVLIRWFNVSVSRRAAYRALKQFLGPHGGHHRLLVVVEDVLASSRLVDEEGTWSCVTVLDEPGPIARCLFGQELTSMNEGRFPHLDGQFDEVILDHSLEHFEDDRVLIGECHRVLKEQGRLIILTQADRNWSLVGPIRALMGLRRPGRERADRGYTESHLFDALKDGFNAEQVSSWSRFFVELVEIFIQVAVVLAGAGRAPSSGQVGDADRTLVMYRKVARIHAWFYPLALMGALLDKALILVRGHSLGVVARRRAWKPRVTPTLVDGRSIADATINTKIGSAGPF